MNYSSIQYTILYLHTIIYTTYNFNSGFDGSAAWEVDGPALDYQWNSAGAEAGLHTIIVEATDQAGNVGRASHAVRLTSRATPAGPGRSGSR